MSQQENETQNPQHEDKGNQKTNQESGRNDLNPTDRDEKDTPREFDLDEDKKRNLDITSKSKNSDKDRNGDEKKSEKGVPPHEDPNVNADSEGRKEKFGSMRNQPNVRTLGSEE